MIRDPSLKTLQVFAQFPDPIIPYNLQVLDVLRGRQSSIRDMRHVA